MKYFVWINTTVGVQGQIWHNEPLSGEGQKSQQPLFIKKLIDFEEEWSLDECLMNWGDGKPDGQS